MRVTLVTFLMIMLIGGVAPDTPGIGPGGGITDIIPIISSTIIILGIIMVTSTLDNIPVSILQA